MHNNNKSDSSWLEQELRRDLALVEAPPELWERVQTPARHPRMGSQPLAWGFAVVVVAAAGLGLWSHESHAAGAASAVEFQSGDPVQIRMWAKRGAGLDIALPDKLAPSVQLVGARVVDAALPAVEVSYRAWGQAATLLVARDSGSVGMRHADLRAIGQDGKISWVMHGQLYTLSCFNPEDARAACLLCHMS